MTRSRHTRTGSGPTVHLLFTGGTATETFDPRKQGSVPTLDAAGVLALLPRGTGHLDLRVEELWNLGSADINPSHWVALASRCNTIMRLPESRGIVVVHGTDTLEESAFFLDLTVSKEKPVVLTGAIRSASHPDADGPGNIQDALCVATDATTAHVGTVIVMGGFILPARGGEKTDTEGIHAITAPQWGPIGTVDQGRVELMRAPALAPRHHMQPGLENLRVEVIMHYAGADGTVVRALMAYDEIDGLVVAGTGSGNVGEAMYDALLEARSTGIPVVMSTRVRGGRVATTHAAKGRGASLKEIGVALSGMLSPQKARILLMLSIGQGFGPDELQQLFDTHDQDSARP